MIRRAERVFGSWAKGHMRLLILVTLLGVLSAIAIWAVPSIVATQHQQQRSQQQINGLSRALDAQREQVRKLGATPVAPPADKVKQNPSTPIPSPSTSVVGPTFDQVYAAVAAFCAQKSQPCRAPDTPPAQVYAAVANFLQQHPAPAGATGATGPGPTADQLADAITKYCSQDTAPCKGAKGDTGDKGDQGPGPTADQLAQAVHDYMVANPPPMCPDGTSATAETVLTAAGPVDAVICVRSG